MMLSSLARSIVDHLFRGAGDFTSIPLDITNTAPPAQSARALVICGGKKAVQDYNRTFSIF